MADFVAVIRKAVDNLPENTPENRSKVYSKARAAIRRQLEAINPPPSDEVIARQLDKLDLAIDEVESEHAEALPADADETDALMAELESLVEKSPVLDEPAPQPPSPAPQPPTPAQQPVSPPAPPRTPQAPPEPVYIERERIDAPAAAPVAAPPRVSAPAEPASRPSDLVGEAHDEAFGLGQAPGRSEWASRSSEPARGKATEKGRGSNGNRASRGKGLVVLVLLLLLGAVAYGGWVYKDTLTAMIGPSAIDTPVVDEETAPAQDTAAVTPDPAAEEPAAEEPSPTELAVAETAAEDDAKFTQRLNPDGTEVDPGPAPGPAPDDTVEGRSVAELTDDGAAPETAAQAPTETPAASEDATPAAQPLGVAQKMILYEERLGQQSLEVKEGTVVWTLASEPSGDGPDEQVIRGEINNPEKGLSALITVKRNTDPSLPASHIVEVVFALPADFEGGSIDQLQRIAMKQTEADQGNPLIAVPAKITQDFYMVALNDLQEARDANTDLLRQRNWIDIPVVYANGRQALITLEKGASGTEVFNQALDAWARAEPAQ
ncbi:MAG: hypothetical protein KUA43_23130 [Hoeflea sp.]|uniref:hypothetical protein n=1 Tax=Hoeflea sp. TaxID=1940281 RepID=UPI001D1CBFD4|nr:hypothetical protein [Hoeflea sp.]MBU4530745.1 hypothetical protein [Alphaproteobacteria bacterium]MBU4544744.1 hypothetical protein [Alphaproteobacteria bacterium]MBU4549300.1 hypothetical protein [Alphaproteobacteria bacterium]MBV1726339.1 hypothetical protein [Hoeflea sp.]MBV1761681.1 hypothetical protein [Hoeflea sp.]